MLVIIKEMRQDTKVHALHQSLQHRIRVFSKAYVSVLLV